jgi:hypothetical protein
MLGGLRFELVRPERQLQRVTVGQLSRLPIDAEPRRWGLQLDIYAADELRGGAQQFLRLVQQLRVAAERLFVRRERLRELAPTAHVILQLKVRFPHIEKRVRIRRELARLTKELARLVEQASVESLPAGVDQHLV